VEEASRLERQRLQLLWQLDGVKIPPEEMKTAGCSQESKDVHAVDLEKIIRDIEHFDQINYLPHDRDHIDWRLVWTKRLGTNWVRPSGEI
jgi:hypothetical protein